VCEPRWGGNSNRRVGSRIRPFSFPRPRAPRRVGAIILLPIFYGIMGFVFTLIGASLFNLAVGMTGGVQIDVQ
jgi:hypothetical protein